MELIDLLFFPSVVMAGIVLWAFATYDKKVAAEQIYASSLTAKQEKEFGQGFVVNSSFAGNISARAFTNKSDTVSLGHGRILFARRIQLFSEGVASLSGHTIAKISATPMPMDTSANR